MTPLILVFVLAVSPLMAQLPSGLTRYTLGYLKSHPNRPALPKEEAAAIQKAHLAHLGDLGRKGELLSAGPILTPGSPIRGIVIFRTESLEKAREMAEADPAVVNKLLLVELHSWTAPKGIGERWAAEAKENPNLAMKMKTYQLVVLRPGPNWRGFNDPDFPGHRDAHMASLRQLTRAGKLVLAGPYASLDNIGGVFVYSAGTLDDARALAKADPFITAGIFEFDVYEWMCDERTMPDLTSADR